MLGCRFGIDAKAPTDPTLAPALIVPQGVSAGRNRTIIIGMMPKARSHFTGSVGFSRVSFD